MKPSEIIHKIYSDLKNKNRKYKLVEEKELFIDEEYNNSSVKLDPPKPPFSGLHYQG